MSAVSVTVGVLASRMESGIAGPRDSYVTAGRARALRPTPPRASRRSPFVWASSRAATRAPHEKPPGAAIEDAR